MLQQFVSHDVAERIVDDLEAVDIDIEDRDRLRRAARQSQRLSEAVEEQGPVRQLSEAVEVRLVLQPALELASFSDVFDCPGDPINDASGVPDRIAAGTHPTRDAIGPYDTVLYVDGAPCHVAMCFNGALPIIPVERVLPRPPYGSHRAHSRAVDPLERR